MGKGRLRRHRVGRQALLPILLWCLGSAEVNARWHDATEAIMGTRVHAELWHEDAAVADRLLRQVMAQMRRIDQAFSPYRESSELSRLNAGAPSGWVEVSDEMFALLQQSARVSQMTAGAFDVTYASVGRYYDYRAGIAPDDSQRKAALEAIDYRYVEFDLERRRVRYAHPDVYVDLGGIAKGHAVDQAIALLVGAGVRQASVSAGGDSRIIGDRRGHPWTVGVKNPRDPDRMSVVLPLIDTAVSTSGDYERYFERDGVRFHHILDPGTGRSAAAAQSVTILGDRAVLTDALSTSVFVLGVERGLALINGLDGIDAIVIDAAGQLHYSDGLEGL